MSLRVSLGPLPEDGTLINPQTALEAFVNGTRVFDFSTENFLDSGVAFFISQTDAPATALINRATTWFKRGEGILYHAHFFTPIEGPHSGVTQWDWVAASGARKEQIVEFRFPIREPGGIVRQTGEIHTTYGVQPMAHQHLMPRVMQTEFTSHTSVSGVSDVGHIWLTRWSQELMDPLFVALDTTATNLTSGNRALLDPCGWSGHDYHVVVECGFCNLAVATAYTGPGAVSYFKGLNDARFQIGTGGSLANEVFCGWALDSSFTGAGTAFGFLRPSLTHRTS